MKFKELQAKIAEEYRNKGYSEEESEKIAAETAADVGRRKYGEKGMEKKAEEGKG
jgi:hypothetical protein